MSNDNNTTPEYKFKPDDPVYSEQTERVALITGITGQDGSFLAEYLLNLKDFHYTVHGIIRRSSSFNTGRIDHIYEDPHVTDRRLILHYGDMTDSTNLISILSKIKPDEIYNLAAQSHVQVSFDAPEYTAEVDGVGTLRLLDAIISTGLQKTCRFYQASTSELYGGLTNSALDEKSPFYPRSPYGVAKLFGFWIVINYREAHGIFACNGILFNHESERRGATFVTRKITRGIARIMAHRKQQSMESEDLRASSKDPEESCLFLGNLDAKRDWGHAKDYVRGMWMMLQKSTPEDYVLSTNETHSVREFVEKAFKVVDVEIVWEGSGLNEVGKEKGSGKILVKIDPKYFRPTEVNHLLGNSAKATAELPWKPDISFNSLVEIMVKSDMKAREEWSKEN